MSNTPMGARSIVVVSTIVVIAVSLIGWGISIESDRKSECAERGGILMKSIGAYVCIDKGIILKDTK